MQDVTEWNNDTLFERLSNFAEESAYKKAQILWCVRIALTGKLNTPGGATEMAVLLGKSNSIIRLQQAINNL